MFGGNHYMGGSELLGGGLCSPSGFLVVIVIITECAALWLINKVAFKVAFTS